MERINVSESFRMCKTNTHFEMRFAENTDTKKALEAMLEVIDPKKYEDPYLQAFSPLFIQDLGDNRTDNGFDFDSSLRSYEYEDLIPAMLKAIAKALPDASFEGCANFDDTSCYYIHDFEFSYNGKQLYIKSTFMDDEKGYFCPDCGYQVAEADHVFDSDEIECEDCEEIIKVADLKYVPADVTEETIDI